MDSDYLTGLYTMRYMKHNYRDYCNMADEVYMIAVDFAKLKHINDHFGHEEGDICLKLFAFLARKYFKDAILARRSGDEFIFLVHEKLEKIQNILVEMDAEIDNMYQAKKMKVRFGFNSGIKLCSNDFYDTLKKADFTMYYAKNSQELYHIYEEKISQKMIKQQEFISHIDELCAVDNLHLAYQFIYTIQGEEIDICEYYARDEKGNTIFAPELYHLLKINHRFNAIDWRLIDRMFREKDILKLGHRIMINIHYQTLVMRGNEFIERIKEKIDVFHVEPCNYIFSIHVNDFDYDFNKLFYMMKELKQLGFGICLDSYEIEDSGIVVNAISKVDVDYVKIKKEFLLQMIHRSKKKIIATHFISMLLELNIHPIFSCVETKEQKEFIEELDKKCLAKGNYFHKTTNINERDGN